MANIELPSIQRLLSSLEEPLERPEYMLPALILPGRAPDVTHMRISPSTQAPALPHLPAVGSQSATISTNPEANAISRRTSRASPTSSASSSPSSTATHCTCKSQRRNSSHIPRPRNAFILFRQHFHYELFPKNENMLSALGSFKTNSEISREIGQRWRGLSQKEKQYWHDLALQEKEKHKLMYPDYKYIPRKMEIEARRCDHCLKKSRCS